MTETEPDSPELGSLSIGSRKYLGSKQRLIRFIRQAICSRVPAIGRFVDGFAGTGVVADAFARDAESIVANDLLFSNYVVIRAYLCGSERNVGVERVRELLSELNGLEPVSGYAVSNYGGRYFTERNAGAIDAVRERIEVYAREGMCTEQEKLILLTSLLYGADKVANTVGQYDAYLKHIGEASYDGEGKHLIDDNVYRPLCLKMPRIRFDVNAEVHNEDLNSLIRRIRGNVLYLDPPYNTRQYVDCYHVLENIARWGKPPLFGKTRKFDRDELKSRFSRRADVEAAFADCIDNADFGHIFVSYNNEGILSRDTIGEVLQSRGPVEVLEEDYSVFGNGAGRSRKRPIIERLYCCRVRR